MQTSQWLHGDASKTMNIAAEAPSQALRSPQVTHSSPTTLFSKLSSPLQIDYTKTRFEFCKKQSFWPNPPPGVLDTQAKECSLYLLSLK
jgi:hypothetical protein